MAAGGWVWTPGWDSWLDLATTRSPTPSWGSTLGAARFHGRVRNGVGWGPRAVITRSSQESKDQRSDARGQTDAGDGGDVCASFLVLQS